MDGLAIISALLLESGCVEITSERLDEVFLSLILLKCLHHLSYRALQSVEDFKTLTEIFQGNSEHLKQSILDLLTVISTNKELSNALLMRYIRRLLPAGIRTFFGLRKFAGLCWTNAGCSICLCCSPTRQVEPVVDSHPIITA